MHLARYSSLPPDELIKECAHSTDSGIWGEFVSQFHPLIAGVVLRTARHWCDPSRQLLDDLIQETYLKLCADGRRLLLEFETKHPGSAFGFLKVVAANVVHDHFRSMTAAKRGGGRDEKSIEHLATEAETHLSTAATLEGTVLIRQIEDCLNRCAPGPKNRRDRIIFRLYYRQGYTARAIASLPQIGLSTKGVESTILRLTRVVRKGLAFPEEPLPNEAEGEGFQPTESF
jgi:RNA polymerase sigma-70 factor, ECF subfamily